MQTIWEVVSQMSQRAKVLVPSDVLRRQFVIHLKKIGAARGVVAKDSQKVVLEPGNICEWSSKFVRRLVKNLFMANILDHVVIRRSSVGTMRS